MKQKRQIIVHIHIFKNAGTTFDYILKNNFGNDFIDHRDDQALLDGKMEYLINYLDKHTNIKAFSSHSIYFQLVNTESYEFYPVFFLRHPIERIKSVYTFEKKQTDSASSGAKMASQLNFKEYVKWRMQDDAPATIRNAQCIFLSAQGPNVAQMEQKYKHALCTLNSIAFVGIVDRFDESLLLLKKTIDKIFPNFNIAYVQQNVSDANTSAKLVDKIKALTNELGKKLVGSIKNKNKYDLLLYNEANNLLTKQIEQLNNTSSSEWETMKNYRGNIDNVTISQQSAYISGWFCNSESPNQSINGKIMLGAQVIADIECDQFRQDLLDAELGNGQHAFNIKINRSFHIDEAKQFRIGSEDGQFLLQQQNCQVTEQNQKESKAPKRDNIRQLILEKIDGLDTEAALRLLKNELKSYPENDFIHLKIGDLFLRLKWYNEAIEYYEKACQLNNQLVWSFHNLSVACGKNNNWEKAAKLLIQVKSLEPEFWEKHSTNFFVNFHLANIQRYENNLADALRTYTTAYDQNKNSIETFANIIDILIRQNDTLKLLETTTNNKEISQDIIDDAILILLDKQVNSKSSEDDIEYLQQLLLVSPNNNIIHQKLNNFNISCLNRNNEGDSLLSHKNHLASFDNFLKKMGNELHNFKGN